MASSWMGYCSNTNYIRRFRCENNNIDFTYVQPLFYRVRQVESCHRLGWSSQALILSNWALGARYNQTSLWLTELIVENVRRFTVTVHDNISLRENMHCATPQCATRGDRRRRIHVHWKAFRWKRFLRLSWNNTLVHINRRWNESWIMYKCWCKTVFFKIGFTPGFYPVYY